MGGSAAWANSTLYGAYDPRQQESLWNTAIELQAQGRHEEAIPVLKRATHLSRINEGLDAASQLPYVRAEIQSYRALDELALADERHAYLSRIEKQVLPSGPERIDAFLRQAEWHQYALLEDIDEDEAIQARMGKAWNFYRRALNESVATYGESSADLLPALHGMVRAQYLLAGHQGVGAAMPGKLRRDKTSTAQSKITFKRGISLLIALQQLNRDRLQVSRETQAEDLIRMGDWAWWTGNRSYALEFYGDAIKLANGEVLNRGPEAQAALAAAEDVKNALGTSKTTDQTPESDKPAASASDENIANATETNGTETAIDGAGVTTAELAKGNSDIPDAPAAEAVTETEDQSGADTSDNLAYAEGSSAHPQLESAEKAVSGGSNDIASAQQNTEVPTEKYPTFRILETPVPLPAIEGFDPVLTVKTEPATEADLIVTFTVNANGKVDNLEKVQVPETTGTRSPDRVLRKLRRLRFRPVFKEGKPVESEAITWVFGPELWASPYDSTAEVST